MTTPALLRDLVAELYAEIRDQLPPQSWHCREIACLALGADRARGGHGHLNSGTLRLSDGNVTQHSVYVCDDPHGLVIDGCEGRVRLSERASLGLTLGGTFR
jgi:hypothetical protein